MKRHGRKMVAPIAITAVVVLYYGVLLGFLLSATENRLLKAIACIVPALLGAVMIGVCVQRIKEIKGGEEDDLSQY